MSMPSTSRGEPSAPPSPGAGPRPSLPSSRRRSIRGTRSGGSTRTRKGSSSWPTTRASPGAWWTRVASRRPTPPPWRGSRATRIWPRSAPGGPSSTAASSVRRRSRGSERRRAGGAAAGRPPRGPEPADKAAARPGGVPSPAARAGVGRPGFARRPPGRRGTGAVGRRGPGAPRGSRERERTRGFRPEDPVKDRTLGRTGLTVSRLALGCTSCGDPARRGGSCRRSRPVPSSGGP